MPQNLTIAVTDLRAEVARLRREFQRRNIVVALLCVALLVAVLGMIRIQLSNDARIRENNLRWCPMVSVLVPGPGDAPAATPRGREIAARASILADQFGCPVTSHR
jgi:hypothetical protein